MYMFDVLSPVNLPQTTEEALEIRNRGGGGGGGLQEPGGYYEIGDSVWYIPKS